LSYFFETRNRHFNDAFDIWREWEARGFSSMMRALIAPVEPAPVQAIDESVESAQS
jgi:hypothetical protein